MARGSVRKKPILLRIGPMSGCVRAIFRYTRSKGRNSRDIIKTPLDDKEDVTADFDALVCELLFDTDSTKIIELEQLDGASRSGISSTETERDELKKFRERLIVLVERHNNEGHGDKNKPSP